MTIFLKMLKYDYMQYDYFFEKIVIFYEKNMTKKKPMVEGPTRGKPKPAVRARGQPTGSLNHRNKGGGRGRG